MNTELQGGGPMTAEKLREIANWLDLYDRIAARYLDILGDEGVVDPESLERARDVVASDEIQQDLRRWADELEESQYWIDIMESTYGEDTNSA